MATRLPKYAFLAIQAGPDRGQAWSPGAAGAKAPAAFLFYGGTTMNKLEGKDRKVLDVLFSGHKKMPSMIQSVLEGGLGEVEVDSISQPCAGRVSVAGFQFFAGDPTTIAAAELVKGLDSARSPDINQWIIPETPEWTALIEKSWAGTEYWTPTRYRMSGELLDRSSLKILSSRVADGYEIKLLDESLAERAAKEIDVYLTKGFESPKDFVSKGFGYCAMKGDVMAAACTTFAVCKGGVEFEIDTHPDHRKLGLATCLGAKMTVETLERGLEPSWDAAWDGSAGLGKKLGFKLVEEYRALVR